MRSSSSVLPLAFSLLLAACARGEAPAAPDPAPILPAAQEQPATSPGGASAPRTPERKRFGAEIVEKNAVTLEAIVKEPARYGDKVVRTEGVVTAVCKHRGCWMEIASAAAGPGQVHVKMAGHGFFVPRDADGRHAVVQGRVLPLANDECTEEAEHQTGTVAKLQIEATGVELD